MTARLQPNGRLLCPGCNQRADADATGQIPSGSPVCTCCDQPFPAPTPGEGLPIALDDEWRDELIQGRRPPHPHDAIAFDNAIEYLMERNEAVVKKYRTLRRHVRKDGVVKLALPRHVAEAEAVRLTGKYGKPYTAYPCSLCNGQYHTGTRRDELTTDTTTEDTPSMDPTTIKISGASDDLVYLEPAVDGLDEIGCFDNDVKLLVRAGDTAVRVTMRYDGVWSAELAQIDEDHPLPEINIGWRGYTVEVEVAGVTSVEHEVVDRG